MAEEATLVSVFEKHITSTACVKYPDKMSSKLDKSKLEVLHDLLEDLLLVNSKLNFNDRPMREALKFVSDKKGWFVENPQWHDDYCKTISGRIRCACRHVKQAWIKGRKVESSWIHGFLPEPGMSAAPEPGISAAPGAGIS
eukprot:6489023-Amphidinium_carterae.1